MSLYAAGVYKGLQDKIVNHLNNRKDHQNFQCQRKNVAIKVHVQCSQYGKENAHKASDQRSQVGNYIKQACKKSYYKILLIKNQNH